MDDAGKMALTQQMSYENIILSAPEHHLTLLPLITATKGKERVKASPVIASLQIHYRQNTWCLEEA